LTFLLTPVVALIEKLGTGRVASVLTTMLVSIAVLGGMGWMIANQLVDVANQLPLYRQNIQAKIAAFHIPVKGQVGHAAEILKGDRGELAGPVAASPAPPSLGRNHKQPPASPMPVRMIEPPTSCSREKTCGTAFCGCRGLAS
jgi:hypothetical protein